MFWWVMVYWQTISPNSRGRNVKVWENCSEGTPKFVKVRVKFEWSKVGFIKAKIRLNYDGHHGKTNYGLTYLEFQVCKGKIIGNNGQPIYIYKRMYRIINHPFKSSLPEWHGRYWRFLSVLLTFFYWQANDHRIYPLPSLEIPVKHHVL